MDGPYVYEIRVEGRLSDRWSNWFAEMEICDSPDGQTLLKGTLVDQAALFGVLNKVHALNLTLLSLNRVSS
jgi:hypothetical protein